MYVCITIWLGLVLKLCYEPWTQLSVSAYVSGSSCVIGNPSF